MDAVSSSSVSLESSVVPIYRRPAVCGKILFYMIYCLFQFGGLFALNLFIVPYATEDRKFTEQQGSYLLSVNAALDFIGKRDDNSNHNNNNDKNNNNNNDVRQSLKITTNRH